MLPEQGCKSNRGIPKFCKVDLKADVGNAASLLHPGHSFSDFHKKQAIRGERVELVLSNDLLRDHVQGHFHILILLHRVIVVKIDNVLGHELDKGRGHCAVDQALSFR